MRLILSLVLGFKALLCEPADNDDNYGVFMQLLAIVLDHPVS